LTRPLSLDPSLCGFGVSAGDKETIEIQTTPSDAQTQSQNLQRRCQEIIGKILLFVNRNYSPEDELLIVLESPSYGSHGGLVEAGWMLCEIYSRLPTMLDQKVSIIEVAPSTLKKFTTSNGRADKDAMKAAIKEKWGKVFERDPKGNLTDAYALYKYGIAVLNGEIEYTRVPRRGKGKGQKKSGRDKKKSPKAKAA
jgi:hypothetical protein